MEDGEKTDVVVKSEYREIAEAEHTIGKLDVDCSRDASGSLMKYDDPDATECSSSFGNTCSGSDCYSKRDMDDMEVDSPQCIPKNSHVNGRVFKKKKVTDQWSKYISPIRWRCQWLELQMEQQLSQISKYEKELAPYRHEKDVLSKMVELNSSASRTVPMAFGGHTKEKMRRRKRKRDENNIDISTYMSNHVIFSYNEDKKLENQLVIEDDSGDEGTSKNVDIEWLVDAIRSDSSLYEVLLKIEILRSKVSELKANLNKAIGRNTTDISSYPGDFLPGSVPESCGDSVSGHAAAELCTSPHKVSDDEIEETVMTDSSVSSYGGAADLDTTDGMFSLSCVQDLLSQQHILDFCNDDEDDILIDNQQANLDFRLDHAIDKAPGMIKKLESHSRGESTAPSSSLLYQGTSKTVTNSQAATLKPCDSEEKSQLPELGTNETIIALQAPIKPSYLGKKRGLKPKKKHRGCGWVAASGSAKRGRLAMKRQ